MRATIRDYRPGDLTAVFDLWQRAGSLPVGSDGLTVDQAVEVMSAPASVSLVAEIEGDIVAMVVGTAAGATGWVQRLTVAPELDASAVSGQLLDEVESKLAERGVRKLSTLSVDQDAVREQLERHGYESPPDAVYLERHLPATVPVHGDLVKLGGRMIAPSLWGELKGLEHAKQIIDRRVILPLAEPELARRHSVTPPRAIVLFGPPGTGKTTFAMGIASRLAWPFIEVQPSELAADGAELQAKLLATSFDSMLELNAAVVFVDEVEDLASIRHEERRVNPSVTNEFLKQIPRMREADGHLLVCATNWVSRLDPAFLRPGRFDYVLPVGPPDAAARAAIWQRYVGEITDEEVEISELVDASEHFTPADIEFAARKAAQQAFEREHFERNIQRATTEDFLAAIGTTRPSLSQEVVESFRQDTERFARY